MDWAPTASDAADANAAAARGGTAAAEGSGDEAGPGGGLGAACLATAAGDNFLRVFYESGGGGGGGGSGDGNTAAFALDIEASGRPGPACVSDETYMY